MSGGGFFETLRQNLRHALRAIRKNPAFAATAAVTLALGIGGNTAMFTVVHAVLLQPLGYTSPDRLVHISADNARLKAKGFGFSLLEYRDLVAAARSFSGIGAYLATAADVIAAGGAGPEALKEARVSANFLDILGVRPILGRSFLPEEDKPGGPPVAMIGAELWKRRFGGDPRIAGKTVALDAMPYTIVGVLPAGFSFPYDNVDVWVADPTNYTPIPPSFRPRTPMLLGFARLKAGIALDQASTELNVLNRQYALAHPGTVDRSTTLGAVSLRDQVVGKVRPVLWTLFGAVGLVLLIACANVASLLLARAGSRSRELAVRAALGAGRGRLIGQLLTESLLLASAGGILGILLASWAISAIGRLNALNLPRTGEIRVNGLVLGFTVALSLATGVLFGLFPAFRASRPGLADVLRERGAGAEMPEKRRFLGVSARGMLVVGQVALSIVLLIGAVLLLESFARLRGVDPGFRSGGLLTMKIALPPARYGTGWKRVAFYEDLLRRIEALPGVRGATVAQTLPMTYPRYSAPMQVVEQPRIPFTERPHGQLQSVAPGYFRVLGVSLERGREFNHHDDVANAPPVMVIDESLARRFWPAYPGGPDPVGQHLLLSNNDAAPAPQIVGIVADVHEGGLDENTGPEIYLPLALRPPPTSYVAVRVTGDPLSFANAVRRQIAAIDPAQAVSEIQTMDDIVDRSVGQRRLTLLLLGFFAALAVALAVVGIYGVIAYSVARRSQELGIRRALGAQQGDILRLVLGQGFGLALAGVGLGTAAALALARVTEGLLFHVNPSDPATFAGIGLLFIVVALAASYLPARRATRIDPMSALR